MKGLEVISAPLITELQASEIAEPAKRALDNIAGLSQPATVRPVFPKRFQEGLDPQPLHQPSQGCAAVPGVPLQGLRFDPRSATWPGNRRHPDDQVQGDLIVTRIGRRRFDDQGQTLSVG